MADVPIVGAGPVGLPLACELARHGARCRIVDGAAQPSPYCRAIGVTPRTLEVWEDMGLAREMIDAGLWLTGLRTVLYGQPPVDALSPPLDLPYASLGLPQSETERVLTRHLERCGLRVERGLRLAALEQDDAGVRVRLQDDGGAVAEAGFRYVVGCDGAHSTVRRPLADLQGGRSRHGLCRRYRRIARSSLSPRRSRRERPVGSAADDRRSPRPRRRDCPADTDGASYQSRHGSGGRTLAGPASATVPRGSTRLWGSAATAASGGARGETGVPPRCAIAVALGKVGVVPVRCSISSERGDTAASVGGDR